MSEAGSERVARRNARGRACSVRARRGSAHTSRQPPCRIAVSPPLDWVGLALLRRAQRVVSAMTTGEARYAAELQAQGLQWTTTAWL